MGALLVIASLLLPVAAEATAITISGRCLVLGTRSCRCDGRSYDGLEKSAGNIKPVISSVAAATTMPPCAGSELHPATRKTCRESGPANAVQAGTGTVAGEDGPGPGRKIRKLD